MIPQHCELNIILNIMLKPTQNFSVMYLSLLERYIQLFIIQKNTFVVIHRFLRQMCLNHLNLFTRKNIAQNRYNNLIVKNF